MKKLILFALPLALLTGCLVAVPKQDRGKKHGWFKNRNNPHHQPAEKRPQQK